MYTYGHGDTHLKLAVPSATSCTSRSAGSLDTVCLAYPQYGVTRHRTVHSALQTVCRASDCLANQLTAAEARAVLAIPMSLQQYAEQQIYLYLFSAALLFATAAVLIWRRSNDWAAVLGAFILASLATGSLAQAYAQSVPVLELAARISGSSQ